MASRRFVPGFLAAVAGLALAAGCDSTTAAPPQKPIAPPASQTAVAPAPPAVENVVIAADLPPLPPGVLNGARPPEVVKAVYEFAARHPEVLNYMPCFCSCPAMGHKNNDDCFIAGRDAKGKVTAWESHGMVCEVCIDVAQQAMQMHNAGGTTAAIRDAIDKKYDTYNRPHTPTPKPPASGDLQR
jgi:Protein of unknown function with PCYCGC motif